MTMIREVFELRRMFRNRKLSHDELEALKERQLRAVIHNAYKHVPYYRSLFKAAGISPKDIRTLEDTKKIPISTKDQIRVAGPEHTLADWTDPSDLIMERTSGITGKPFTVYRTAAEARTIWLLHMATMISSGTRARDRSAIIGPNWRLRPRFYHRLGFYQSLLIPLATSMDEQIRLLEEFQPTVLFAFPSTLRALLNNLRYPLRNVIRPRIVITAGEVLDPLLKERIKADLKAEIFDSYGSIEFGRISWECTTHEGLHVNADHFIVECLDGDQSVQAGQTGPMVVTKLFGFAMPFIRYRLGDLASLVPTRCSCGSAFPLMDPPEGRELDVMKLPSGKILSTLRFGHIMVRVPSIDQWRVIQNDHAAFVLQLVMQNPPDQDTLTGLRSQFLEYIAEPITLNIELVDYITDDSPKFRTFISRVAH